jgi:hypothetical protein
MPPFGTPGRAVEGSPQDVEFSEQFQQASGRPHRASRRPPPFPNFHFRISIFDFRLVPS